MYTSSILRDDLVDGGAAHIAATVVALKATKPSLMVEVGVKELMYKFSHFKSGSFSGLLWQ